MFSICVQPPISRRGTFQAREVSPGCHPGPSPFTPLCPRADLCLPPVPFVLSLLELHTLSLLRLLPLGVPSGSCILASRAAMLCPFSLSPYASSRACTTVGVRGAQLIAFGLFPSNIWSYWNRVAVKVPARVFSWSSRPRVSWGIFRARSPGLG